MLVLIPNGVCHSLETICLIIIIDLCFEFSITIDPGTSHAIQAARAQ